MANKLYEETHIQNIANAIREKTGKTDTMTIGQMAGEIQAIANLPTDALEGLEGGYDVMFYDGNKMALAMYSIKAGHSINPPVYDGEWQLADGSLVTFPYTPTEDTFFYILTQTYADQLYAFYGVDAGVYPYVWLLIMSGPTAMLVFGKRFSGDTLYEVLKSTQRSVTISDFTNLIEVVNAVTSKITVSDLKTTDNVSLWEDSSYKHYVNFDYTFTSGTCTSLNQ